MTNDIPKTGGSSYQRVLCSNAIPVPNPVKKRRFRSKGIPRWNRVMSAKWVEWRERRRWRVGCWREGQDWDELCSSLGSSWDAESSVGSEKGSWQYVRSDQVYIAFRRFLRSSPSRPSGCGRRGCGRIEPQSRRPRDSCARKK